MALDWDKLRIFHAAAEAGSFTHAADVLNLSQSAISRQVAALEQEVGTPLFHRHARGLVLSEQGELLFHTASDVLKRLEQVRMQLTETREKPTGKLRVTTTVGLGSGWLTERAKEFLELYPDLELQLVFDNEEIDLTMRKADAAIRLRQPQQPDLIQRRLFTVHLHVYASPAYLNRFGTPETVEDLDNHRIITFGEPAPNYLRNLNTLETVGLPDGKSRSPILQINNLMAIRSAIESGIGLALLPDYMIDKRVKLVQVLPEMEMPTFDTYLCYPEQMRNAAKLKVFRDFLISKARTWAF
ncbi:MAG: LysR family transcriptional regulator [Aurantimonas coralicida]|jgi:DNA-binding transcriptional LysR family regulator|uniref:LysR family transcriptional regulator n=1 Tax=Aurantimonas TaxID=182269 RepID=UPI00041891CB|nr:MULTISPECIES: LysR family transcriptional regulator [Aurantimonas]MAP17498.1 LysR family transcriptional regulator [Aurantimonas sp.]MCW7545865.1 LysR family transcriptional regulator [Aurantimonas litoralis]MAY29466.1 LysR family transcriptional regulator [Aurantimonas sp.]MBC6716220.1 LysR family transcriptional regulator [Aurantimonas sp. DM33-3]MCC4299821.1 LysR family transcriptional regulator [Aurantimonas coralicida]